MVNEMKKENKMKERISKLLKQHAELETNLSSEAGRELLTNEILDILNPNTRTDEWRIEQFNRNRAPEDQVHSIQEMSDRVQDMYKDKYIFESPDGKTIFRRPMFSDDPKEKEEIVDGKPTGRTFDMYRNGNWADEVTKQNN